MMRYFGQAFRLVEKGPFRRLLMYLRPALADKDIPHRTFLQKEILKCAELVEAQIKTALQVNVSVSVFMPADICPGCQRPDIFYL